MYRDVSLQECTQIWIFGLKIYHLATMIFRALHKTMTRKGAPLPNWAFLILLSFMWRQFVLNALSSTHLIGTIRLTNYPPASQTALPEFFFMQHTKTGKNILNGHKNTKWQ
jgi:hypothetical protein